MAWRFANDRTKSITGSRFGLANASIPRAQHSGLELGPDLSGLVLIAMDVDVQSPTPIALDGPTVSRR
jgi:hypothetical protein